MLVVRGRARDDGPGRVPLEKQAELLVEANRAAHKNQVNLTVVPNDDYVAEVGAAAGSDSLPDLFAASAESQLLK